MADSSAEGEVLSPEMLTKIQQGAAALEAIGDSLRKMESCGYDCRVEEAWRAALKQRFDALLNEFGRGRRRA